MEITTEQIVRQYQKLVFSVCYQQVRDYFEAENLAQDTFLSFFSKYPDLQEQNNRNLLCRIALNKCRDYLKSSRYRKTVVGIPEDQELADSAATPLETVLRGDAEGAVKRVVEKLKEPYRKVAYLYYIEGFTTRQIAAKCDVSIKTVQTQLYRSKEKLKQYWKEEMT